MVVSQTFPPLIGGTPILLTNLLRAYPGNVVAAAGYSHYSREDSAFTPPCKTVYLRPPSVRLFELAYDRLIARASIALYQWIKYLARKWHPSVILAASPGVFFFISAFRVARDLGIPFYAHMHDLWEENYRPQGGNDFLKRGAMTAQWEKVILAQSQRVLCMTEHQQDFYSRKYGVETDLLPHTVPPDDLAKAPREMLPATRPKKTVLFTGNLYPDMNMDALRVLARASELLPEDFELLFCTNASVAELSALDIGSSRLKVGWFPREELRKLQSSAHVLVAPLSHKNASADEVRTVFSTKLLEYMISGRPTLVFAPTDSFHAWSARRGHWAHVVDRDDPEALAIGIRSLSEREDLARRVVCGSLAEARRRDARIQARRLYEWVLEDSRRIGRHARADRIFSPHPA